MKIIHFSDTHLGFAEYNAADPETGVNRRETDFYKAFRLVVEAIREKKPDLAIHAGDLFDTVRPSNRAITEAIAGLRRILDAGVELVVIAGNHETPKIQATGNIFKALQAALPGAHIVFDGERRVIRAAGAAVHAIADAADEARLQAALDGIEPVKGIPNVAVLHAGTRTLEGKVQSGEFNQHYVPHDRLASLGAFDYIAMGHYHRAMRVDGTKNAWYCGSTERTSIAEAKNVPGYLEVTLGPLDPKHVPIPVRPMLDLGAVPCSGLTHEQVLRELSKALEGRIEGAIARVELKGISPQALAALSQEELARLKKPALHCEIVPVAEEEAGSPGGGPLTFGSLAEEFTRFLASYKLEKGYDRDKVASLGQDYLAESCLEEQE